MNWIEILIVAALYGAIMKLADLFDEHGMHWFKGDKIISGLLWGILGAFLIISRVDIANLILAMILVFIVRMRVERVPKKRKGRLFYLRDFISHRPCGRRDFHRFPNLLFQKRLAERRLI